MALNDLFDFDTTTFTNNSDVAGSDVAENCAPSGINNAIRALAGIVKRAAGSKGSDIASATTTNIAAAATHLYAVVTGTTTITSFGSVAAGTLRFVEFGGALTLTHNATSLKLPGSANITTAAGDVAVMISLGSGNWKCLGYFRADGTSIVSFSGTLTSTDAGAGQAPDFIADRNSASPAASDIIGAFVMRGRDSGANATDYAKLRGKILDPTNASEDGSAIVSAFIAGTETDILTIGPGVQIGAPTGGDKGAGTLNAAGPLYVNGRAMPGPLLHIQERQTSGTNGGGLTSGAWRTRTLNTEVTDEIGSTLASNQFTLPAGTYWAEISTPAYVVNDFKSKLRNITDGADTLIGTNAYTSASNQNDSFIYGRFTIAGTKTFEVQVQVGVTNGTDGGGQAGGFGVTEIYTDVRIWKIG